MLFRQIVVPLEVVAIIVKNLAWALNVSLVPKRLNLSFVGKSDDSKAIFFSISEITLINSAIAVIVRSLAILLPVEPHSLINIAIWIYHFAIAVFKVVFPLAFVNVTVGVVVFAPTLFAAFDYALETISIFEQISALG